MPLWAQSMTTLARASHFRTTSLFLNGLSPSSPFPHPVPHPVPINVISRLYSFLVGMGALIVAPLSLIGGFVGFNAAKRFARVFTPFPLKPDHVLIQ